MKGAKIAARYALHCAALDLASRPRPLCAAFPARDDAADACWNDESERLIAAAPPPADVGRAKRMLFDRGRAGAAARRRAARAVERRHGAGAWSAWAAAAIPWPLDFPAVLIGEEASR